MFSNDTDWILDYTDYDAEHEKHREALCTTGNGYMATRGSAEEAASGPHHEPGTYMAGLYNRLTSRVGDRDIENEDVVNIPDWTWITFRPEGGDWFDIDTAEILDYRRQLDVRRGLLHRRLRVRQPGGQVTTLASTRFTSMDNRHLAVIRYQLTPENHGGTLTLRSGLNGAIENTGVDRYSDLNPLHLERHTETAEGATLTLAVKTVQSAVTIVARARHRCLDATGQAIAPVTQHESAPRRIAAEFAIPVTPGQPVTLEKVVAIAASHTDNDPFATTAAVLAAAGGTDALQTAHETHWDAIWKHLDMTIEGDPEAQRITRIHAYHLLVTASPFNTDLDAGLPARGLHGEAYRGHIFWDEIFVLPVFNLHFPAIAKSLIMYRFRRLDAARAIARENGLRGAMFAWQSGSDGREETQVVHLNPVSGEWGPDWSCLQRHVSLAIAYNTWHYGHITGDTGFLAEAGAELILSIADCWADMCRLNPETGRYTIQGVMGPNEFHEAMPGHDEPGLKDNAYTNVMTAWLLERAAAIPAQLDDATRDALLTKLDISPDRLDRWREIAGRLNVDVRDGLISQYDGFLDLKELDWDAYRAKYGDIGRLDRLLKAEGLQPDDYQVSKQGDLMMLFFVLPLPVVTTLLQRLGVPFDLAMLRRNYDYYHARTTHGSTLSLGVHAHVAALLGDTEGALAGYRDALSADLDDIQGGTTKEGIHAALMASTLTLVMFTFAGLDLAGNVPHFTPRLPADWSRVAFNFSFQGIRYHADLRHDALTLRTGTGTTRPATAQVDGTDVVIPPGQPISVTLTRPAS